MTILHAEHTVIHSMVLATTFFPLRAQLTMRELSPHDAHRLLQAPDLGLALTPASPGIQASLIRDTGLSLNPPPACPGRGC